jgi:general secretion pathway protein F
MPQFHYRAVTPAGNLIAGEIEAPSRKEVLRRIEYVGNIAIEAEAAGPGLFAFAGALFSSAPASRDVTIFLRQLALLLDARLTLEAALQTLGSDAGKNLAKFTEILRESISAGGTFADALERHPSIIDPAYVAMVRAGEASGNLESILHAIVEDRTRRQLLVERIGSALRYPCFLVGSAVVILVFFLVYVVPQFEPVFRDLGGRLNGGVTFVVTSSTWLRGNLNLVLGICLAVVLGTWLIIQRPRARRTMLAAVATLPGFAGFVRDRRAARVIGTLGLLVGNGVALPTALKILRDIVTEPRHAEAAQRLHEQVRNGRRFADALGETDLLPPLAVRMLRVGDETGDLALIARHAAQFYEHRLTISLDRLMGAVGPVTIIFVSTLIGALIVSIMSALLSITDLAT